jgi:hypothetical protein
MSSVRSSPVKCADSYGLFVYAGESLQDAVVRIVEDSIKGERLARGLDMQSIHRIRDQILFEGGGEPYMVSMRERIIEQAKEGIFMELYTPPRINEDFNGSRIHVFKNS